MNEFLFLKSFLKIPAACLIKYENGGCDIAKLYVRSGLTLISQGIGIPSL